MPRKKKGRRLTKKSGNTKGPARAIIKQTPHRIVGAIHYPGLTLYPAEWESQGERNFIYLALLCHDVKAIEAQPQKLTYQDDHGEREYTPDLAITINRGRIFIEGKSLRNLIREENLNKYLAIARSLRARGEQLAFITEDQMPGAWVRNASLLRQYLVPEQQVDLPACVVGALQGGPRSIEGVLTATTATVTLAQMYSYIAHRLLCIDWNVRLGRNAPVSLPDQPNGFARLTYDSIQSTGRFADLVAEMALGRRPANQRLLAAACTRRRPLSAASPTGFVDGFSQWELGHLERLRTAGAAEGAHGPLTRDGAGDRAQPQPTEDL